MAALTPMGIAILASLFERPMHPYEMYQLMISRKDDRILKIRPGSLYHTVDRLCAHDLVRALGTDRSGNRPERTTYEVTETGRTALQERLSEMLGEPAEEYPQFTLALSESHNLDVDAVSSLLRTRIALLEKEIDELTLILGSIPPGDVRRIFYIGLEYNAAMRTAELEFLRTLVDDIASGALPWMTEDMIIHLKNLHHVTTTLHEGHS